MTALGNRTGNQGTIGGIPVNTFESDADISKAADEGDITTALICINTSQYLRNVIPYGKTFRKIEALDKEDFIASAKIQSGQGRKIVFIIDSGEDGEEAVDYYVELATTIRENFPSSQRYIAGPEGTLSIFSKPKAFKGCCELYPKTYEELSSQLPIILR